MDVITSHLADPVCLILPLRIFEAKARGCDKLGPNLTLTIADFYSRKCDMPYSKMWTKLFWFYSQKFKCSRKTGYFQYIISVTGCTLSDTCGSSVRLLLLWNPDCWGSCKKEGCILYYMSWKCNILQQNTCIRNIRILL